MRAVARLKVHASHFGPAVAFILALLLCSSAKAQDGQTSARPDRGVGAGGAYSVSDVENINLQNGNVNLSIPLASLPPVAGGKLSLTVSAFYNSRLWNVTRAEQAAGFPARTFIVDTPQLSDAGGWNVGGGYVVVVRDARDDFNYQLPPSPDPSDGTAVAEYQRLTQHNWYKVLLRTPDGAEHELRPSGGNFEMYGGADHPRSYLWGYHTAVPQITGVPMRYDTTDGTYISAVVNPAGHASGVRWTLFLPDGTQVIDYANGVQRIRDTNGNSVKIFSDGGGAHFQDEQTGREIRVEFDPVPGQGQTRVWYQTAGGVWQHVDVNYGQTVVQGKIYKVNDWNPNVFTESGQQGDVCQRYQQLPTQAVSVVREIVFPATELNTPGRRFSFTYNSDATETATTQEAFFTCGGNFQIYTRTASHGMGALGRMVTPAGAVVDYTYALASRHDFIGPDGADELVRETITAKALTHDGVTDTWAYDIPNAGYIAGSSVTNPDGSSSTERFFPLNPDHARGFGAGGEERSGLVYYVSDGVTQTYRHWATRGSQFATGSTNYTAVNAVVDAEYTALVGSTLMSAKTYEHDYNGNVTGVTEYDWFDSTNIPRDAQGVPAGVPAGAAVLRATVTAYHNAAADASSPNYYRLRELTTGVPSLLGAVKETSTGASRTRFSYDGQAFGAAPTNGNVTEAARLDDNGDADPNNDAWVSTHTSYGAYGNVSSTTDPNGHVTQFFYDDSTHALPTRVIVDPLNGTGAQTTTTAYDYSTGLVTSVTDANGQVSTVDYTNQLLDAVDPFGRPGVATGPAVTVGGVSQRRKVFTFYEDGARRVRVESDLNAEGDRLLKSRETRDQLGRPALSERSEDGSTYTVSSQTVYAQAGRVTMQSNPTRGDGSSPDGWTRVTKDAAGRVVEVATFAGSAQPSTTAASNTVQGWTGSVTTAYAANETTVTDQTNRSRKSVADALGRLVRVVEAPGVQGYGFETSYAYDSPGNLRRVDQGGQLRFFMYDSLSRLIRAKNPEQGDMAADANFPALTDAVSGTSNAQWSTGYLYDAAGNLVRRKDARGVVTTYGYDGLNRNTSVSYEAPNGVTQTPAVTRSYDGAILGKGRLWKSESAGTGLTTVEEYDAAGRPLRQSQQFWANGAWGTPYTVEYGYDLAGNVTSEKYPSQHAVSYTYDDAGLLSGFTGNLGGEAHGYADSIAYDPAGRVRQERFGTGTPLYHKLHYNSRGQLFDIRLSTVAWATDQWNWNRGALVNYYSSNYAWEGATSTTPSPDNNSNLRRQEHWVPADDQISSHAFTQQTYEYDALNRLSSVAEAAGANYAVVADTFRQAYDYDRWGNRTVNAAGTWLGQQSAPPSDSVNEKQFDTGDLQNTNRLYAPGDAALPMGQRRMRYDAAGNLTYDAYTGVGSRAYDAENRMMSAADQNGGTAAYAYDGDGRRVKRLAGSVGEVWQVYGAGGELLAEYAKDAAPTSPQKEYGYRGGELLVTAESSSGWGPAPAFTGPDPLKRGDTILLEHLMDLRAAVNQLRRHAGLSDYNFTTDPEPVRKVTTVKAEHIRQLRRALEEALTRLGRSVGGYAHPTLYENVSPIYAADFQELRKQVRDAGGVDVRWVVADQLGTPRMVVDRSGSLAGVTRHDYLPFGEEVAGDATWRTKGRGYQGDATRQRFTGKERDDETNLDYFVARYYAPAQGRFTGFDPGPFTIADPQSWNRYSYVQNNPLKFTDPDGEKLTLTGPDADYIVGQLEKATGYTLIRDKKTGVVTIDATTKRNSEGTSKRLADKLKEIANPENKVEVNIYVGANLNRTLGDSYDDQAIDAADYRAYEKDAPELGAALLGHVLDEYYEGAKEGINPKFVSPAIFGLYHKHALAFEGAVLSDLTGKEQGQRPDMPPGVGKRGRTPGVWFRTDEYTYNQVTYDILIKTVITNTGGRRREDYQVTGVKRR